MGYFDPDFIALVVLGLCGGACLLVPLFVKSETDPRSGAKIPIKRINFIIGGVTMLVLSFAGIYNLVI